MQEYTLISTLLQQLISTEGADYTKVRDDLVSRGEKARPSLNRVIEESSDWRQELAATIILGWLDNLDLYRELWNWFPDEPPHINYVGQQARRIQHRFAQEGNKVIPLMLELVWKEEGIYYCKALPPLLAEAKVILALPVMVRREELIPRVVGQYGSVATLYILEVLDSAEPPRRYLLVISLGFTKDTNAIPPLRVLLQNAHDSKTQKFAAWALGQLGDYVTLRTECSRAEFLDNLRPSFTDLEARFEMLKGLTGDQSDETHEVLVKIATTASPVGQSRYNEMRVKAIEVLLNSRTTRNITAACQIATKEPDKYTRACMFSKLARANSSLIFSDLSRINHSLICEALMKALKDSSATVRRNAIKGLKYCDDEVVTAQVLKVVETDEDQQCRRAGVSMLKDRVSTLVKQAAVAWIKDEDPDIRTWGEMALLKNADNKV